MIVIDNLSGIVAEVPDEPIENDTKPMEPPVEIPTTEERIEALERALLEVILNG